MNRRRGNQRSFNNGYRNTRAPNNYKSQEDIEYEQVVKVYRDFENYIFRTFSNDLDNQALVCTGYKRTLEGILVTLSIVNIDNKSFRDKIYAFENGSIPGMDIISYDGDENLIHSVSIPIDFSKGKRNMNRNNNNNNIFSNYGYHNNNRKWWHFEDQPIYPIFGILFTLVSSYLYTDIEKWKDLSNLLIGGGI